MKEYVKPDVLITEFRLNEAIAACEASSSVNPVNVSCLIKSGTAEGVFYSGGCDFVASSSNLITLNGKQYLYWYGPDGGFPQESGTNADGYYVGTTLMDKLKDAGISQFSGSNVLHAGPATPKVISVINSST